MTQHLIGRVLEGDEVAAQALHSAHYPAVFRLAYLLLQNIDDADDATQEAFIYAFTHLDKYDAGRSPFGSWLKVIVTSRCRDLQRKHRITLVSLQDLTRSGHSLEDLTIAHQPDAMLQKTGLQQSIWAALDQVPGKSRQALILRYYGELSYPQMAKALGCGVSTAKSRVAYGLGVLSGLLQSEDSEFPASDPKVDGE